MYDNTSTFKKRTCGFGIGNRFKGQEAVRERSSKFNYNIYHLIFHLIQVLHHPLPTTSDPISTMESQERPLQQQRVEFIVSALDANITTRSIYLIKNVALIILCQVLATMTVLCTLQVRTAKNTIFKQEHIILMVSYPKSDAYWINIKINHNHKLLLTYIILIILQNHFPLP